MKKLGMINFIAVLMLSFCLILSPSAQEQKEAEGKYTIKSGDTLWDISSKFLKDPFLWPKLWQRNPYITNPHWIYPGNPIRLSTMEEGKKEEPKKAEVEKIPIGEVKKVEPLLIEKIPEVIAETKPIEGKIPVSPEGRSAGFMSDLDYRGIGIILQNREGKVLMAENDIVYLTFKPSKSSKPTEPILIGNKYTIFRPSEIIRHPVTGQKVGRKYNITGNIQIIDEHGSFYTAKIIEAFESILIGDLVRHYVVEKMEFREGTK